MTILVNGERVVEQEIQAEGARLHSAGAPDAAERAKNNVIDRILLRQEADKAAQTVSDAEVEVELQKHFAQAGGKDMFLQRNRLQEKDLGMVRTHIVQGIRVGRLIEEATEAATEPSEEEMRAYFAGHSESFTRPAQVQASHIVKRPNGPDDEETFATMCDIRQRLIAGEDFASLAAEFSDCSSEPGGDLGWFAKGHMVPEFESVAFSLNDGEVSPVFITQFGMHVMKLGGRRESYQPDFDEVAGELREHLVSQAKDKLMDDYLDSLRANAEIVEIEEQAPGDDKGKKGKKGKKKKK